jgi:hypothetical protein
MCARNVHVLRFGDPLPSTALVRVLINARSFSASAATLSWRFACIALPNKL